MGCLKSASHKPHTLVFCGLKWFHEAYKLALSFLASSLPLPAQVLGLQAGALQAQRPHALYHVQSTHKGPGC